MTQHPFNLDEFEKFCRSKGDERYDYGNPWNCALAQFEKSLGAFTKARGSRELAKIGLWLPLSELPRTFSALADRLSALGGEG